MILGCDFFIALKGFFLAGKLGVMRVVTSQLGFIRAFSIRVFITRNVVPTVMGQRKKVRKKEGEKERKTKRKRDKKKERQKERETKRKGDKKKGRKT